MKKTLIRAISFCLTLCLLTGLLAPLAGAVEYEGIEPITVNATAALLVDLDTDQVLLEQSADETRYPASITKIMTAMLALQELEPELSVESLLASTRENESDMEDIAYSEKSEARLLIEKFVDEKPEAVASLLRNWLNEDWD